MQRGQRELFALSSPVVDKIGLLHKLAQMLIAVKIFFSNNA